MRPFSQFNPRFPRRKEEIEKTVGQFQPIQKRKEVAKEVKRSHFTLGNDYNFPEPSSKDHFPAVEMTTDPSTNDSQRRLSENNKRSHFTIGNSKFVFRETTNQKNQKDFEEKKELVKQIGVSYSGHLSSENYKFGFEKNTFDTTAKEHYNEKDTGKPPVSSVGVKTKNSGHNFIYGYAKPTYTTTVGSTYQVHDVRDSFKIASLIKEKGEKFKQTSFQLGNDEMYTMPIEVPKVTPQEKKVQQFAKDRALELKKSTFKIGDENSGNEFQSMNQIVFKGTQGHHLTPQGKKAETESMRKDVRATHFMFGTDASENKSSSHHTFQKHEISGGDFSQRKKLGDQMQQAHFAIGNKQDRRMLTNSSYIDTISRVGADEANYQMQPSIIKAGSTISIGQSGNVNYVTEAKSKFVEHDTQPKLKPVKKPDTISLGNAKSEFTTMYQQVLPGKVNLPGHTSTGTVSNPVGGMNMQKTTFTMGSYGNQFKTSNQTDFNESEKQSFSNSAPPSQSLNVRQARNGGLNEVTAGKVKKQMLRDNFVLGNTPKDFRTMNQAVFRWIQPAAEKI